MISIQGVTRTYRSGKSTTTIGPVDLTIPAGGITALVGPNGAGKSTLLTMIGRLQQPDSGQISVGGLNVATTDSRELARTVAILKQENNFVTRLTVRQLIQFGRFPYCGGRLTEEDERHVNDALSFFDLHPFADRFLDELSGGQRQRAYVAMVIAQDTDYILLDEPLNNLDMKHTAHMLHQLRRAADELGRTIIIVVHDINFAAAIGDRIVAMRDGQVVAQGTPEHIMNPETLKDIFDVDVTVVDTPAGRIASYF